MNIKPEEEGMGVMDRQAENKYGEKQHQTDSRTLKGPTPDNVEESEVQEKSEKEKDENYKNNKNSKEHTL